MRNILAICVVALLATVAGAADQYIHNMTDTWTDVGTTYDAVKMTITNTNSAADSDLLDISIASAGYIGVNKSGVLRLSNDGTDIINLYHASNEAYLKWNDGYLNLQTDEGTNTDTVIYVDGKGSGVGVVQVTDGTATISVKARTIEFGAMGNSTYVGTSAGYADDLTDNRCTGVGYQTLYSNTGAYCTASGYQALYSNTGASCTASGHQALRSNTGASCTASGMYALYYNTGASCTGSGASVLYYNTGASNVAAGYNAMLKSDHSTCTAIGNEAFNTFSQDAGSAEEVDSVDHTTERVTITGHGFGVADTRINLYATTTGALPAGLAAGPDQWKVIDANTLQCMTDTFTDAGTGTHTLTPQYAYSNSTAIGYNAEPTASNQVVLGDANVTEVLSYGAITSTESGGDKVWMSHDGTDAQFGTDDGSFVFQTDEGTNTDTVIYVDGKGTGVGVVQVTDGTATISVKARTIEFGAMGYSTYVGTGAGYADDLTDNYNTGIGYQALYSNTGASCTASGYQALRSNTGANCTASGSNALQSNTGASCTASGVNALQSNTGANCTASGVSALRYNTGADCTASGTFALYFNTGASNFAGGYNAMLKSDHSTCTAIGNEAFNTFTQNAGSAEEVDSVDHTTERVTITGHGFGVAGTYKNLYATTTGALPTGLTAGPDQWKVIDANTLQCMTDTFTDAGTGTHTLTPQYAYTNSTAIGYNAEPTASNQVVLGDANVTSVVANGTVTATTGVTVTAGDIVASQGAVATTPDSTTLGVGATTLAIDTNVVTLTGDGGANVIATITGGVSGQTLILICVDGLVTITDTDAHTANTVDLAGTATDFVSADDTTLTLVFDGTSWYEVSRSVN